MRRKNYLRIPQPLFIQIPGLVTGAFLASLPGTELPTSDRPLDWPTSSINLGDATLRYAEVGQGPPVVFVHGSLGDYRTWGFQIEAFSEHFRTIAYSRRWHYPNQPPPSATTDYSSHMHVHDLARFLSKLDLGPAHLVGNSMGAIIAMQTAILYPERVASLSLCEPGYMPWLPNIPGGPAAWEVFEQDVVVPAKQAQARGDMESAIRIFCEGVLPGWWDRLDTNTTTVILENAQEFDAELNAIEWMSAMSEDDVRGIRVPVLLMRADETPEIFALLEQRFSELLPHVTRRTASDSCHAIQAATPAFFNREVIGFIRRVQAQ